MSYRNLATKPLNASLKSVLKRSGHIGLGLSAFTPVLALANPTGGQVTAGQASIAAHGAGGMVITQASQSAIINWQQFNIGVGQYVQFLQPSSSSVVLNRVIGGSPSSILGNLTANGQVFLVNTNGVYFGKGSSIDTQGFLASSLGISDQNFLAHNYIFNQAGAAGATVVNDGNITAHHSGYVVLAGDYAENDGVISAQSGHVILASGAKATLSLNGNSLINFAVNQSTLANYAGVKNTGSILADGGTVIMTADVANLLKSTVVNNTGLVEAQAISNSGGVIQLLASGGNIQNAGTLDASGLRTGQAGGQITLKGDGRTTLTDASKIYATGEGAKGGSVEVSGNTIVMRGNMAIGKGGRLLMDPTSVEIVAGNTNSSGAHNTSSGESAHVGLAFIEGRLDSGAAVSISAHALIHASNAVKTITGTNPAGDLSLKTSNTGHITLKGVDITIAGNLTASMGYGSFGHLTANTINLTAAGSVDLAKDVVNSKGVITTFSAKTTGGALNINAHDTVGTSAEAGLALNAKTFISIGGSIHTGGDLTLEGSHVLANDVEAGGAFKAIASGGYASFNDIEAHQGVTISATNAAYGGIIVSGNILAYGGNVVVSEVAGSGIHAHGISAQQGSVNLLASHGSVTATGNIRAHGNITVTAKTGGVGVSGLVSAGGTLTLAASSGADINVHSGEAALHGAKGVNLSGDFVTHGSGSLDIRATQGNITIGAGFGDSFEGLGGRLDLIASSGAVKLGKSVFVDGNLLIEGKSLAYTGKNGDFTLSDHGSLTLEASIGTKAAPVKYNIDLKDQGGIIRVEKSIFTADSIAITQTHSASGGTLQGVLFQGASDAPITVSAVKSITIHATNIGIGNARGGSTEVGGVSIIAGKNISLTAVGTGSASGNIGIHAGSVEAGDVAGRNTSMLVQAGGSLDMQAHDISIQGGEAFANASGSKGKHTATAVADVTLQAGSGLSIDASSQVNIQGGRAEAHASGGKSVTLNASADASVNITAGKSLTISGENLVNISGGYGSVVAAAGKKGTATATATAGVNLKAGANLSISASRDIRMEAGTAISEADGGSSGGAVTLNAKTTSGINLTAGQNIKVDAGSRNFTVSAGYGAAFVGAGKGFKASALATADVDFNAKGSIAVGAGSSIRFAETTRDQRFAFAAAGGSSSTALTANADVSVNFIAGKGIAMTAGDSIVMSAGYGNAITDADGKGNVTNSTVNTGISLAAGADVRMQAYGGSVGSGIRLGGNAGSDGPYAVGAEKGAKVTTTVHRDISITAGGSIVLTGKAVTLSAGESVGGGRSESSGPSHNPIPHDIIGQNGGGNVKFTDTANINLTAGGGVTLSASSVVDIHGGAGLANHALVVGASAGVVNADYEAAVNIKAGGAFLAHGVNGATHSSSSGAPGVAIVSGIFAGTHMQVIGSSVGYGATKDTTTLNSGVSITASTVTVTSARAADIGAGAFAGTDTQVNNTGSKAATSLTINSGIAINAKGAFTVSAGSQIDLFGGDAAGAAGTTSAAGGKAAMTVQAVIAIKAGSALLNNSHGGRQSISGGKDAGVQGVAFASAGGSANRTVDASVSITATGAFTMTGADRVLLVADQAAGADALSSNAGGLMATTTISNGLNISAKSAQISAFNSAEMFAGSGVAHGGQVKANGGSATLTVNSGITISATQGITVDVSGSGGTGDTNRRIVLDGGSSAAQGASVNATHGGNAALNVSGGITLTGGGAIALKNSGQAATSNTFTGISSSVQHHFVASHGIYVVAGSRMAGVSGSHGSHATQVQAGLGGGTATLTGNVSVNIAAKGAFSMDAGSGNALLAGASSAGNHMRVGAVASGKATANLTEDVNLTAATATVHGGFAVLAGGSGDAVSAGIFASHGGVATATVESALKITTTGAFGVSAENVVVTSGRGSLSHGIGTGSLAHLAEVGARVGGQATLNANGFVAIKAGSVSLTATNGFLDVFAGKSDGAFASISAAGKGDKANLNVNGTVSINATLGSITMTAEGTRATPSSTAGQFGELRVLAGSNTGKDAHATARNAGATAGLTVDASMNLTAKKAVVATASSGLRVEAGSGGVGARLALGANGKAAVANASVTSSVNVTAGTITLTAKHANISIAGGTVVGGGSVFASHSGHATVTDTGVLNLKASGNVAIVAAAGFVFVGGGFGGFSTGQAFVGASNHGVVSATARSGVSIQAGGSLTVNALNDVRMSAGFGYTASVDAQNGGTATYTQDGSITLQAGTKAQISAGGNVLIFGGGFDRVAGNAFPSASFNSFSHESDVPSAKQPGGTLTANLTDLVTITAGSDVDLAAGSNLVVQAGEGNQEFVGAERLHGFSGQRWAGGTATLALTTSVIVTAGHNLNLTAGGAGTGSLQVLGMGAGNGSHQENQANVNGGSGSAVGKLSLIGNATLTAKNDIVINASGDASIVGGSLGNIRDDHGVGHLTLLGSANATLNAVHDVVLNNITGNLTVAGVNVNSSHAGGILADAHGGNSSNGSQGGSANVTAHADAGITAGNSIRTVTALGGNLNVVGGQFVDAAVLGYASNEQATATASASLTAGNSVTIAATGDLTVAGGLFNSAEIANSFNDHDASASGGRIANVKTRADITAKKTVTLTIGGDAVIAGGDSLTATANMSDDSFETGTATADAGVSIKGSSVTLNVAGNLLMRGGSAATAKAIGIGGSIHAAATATADASIAGKVNVVINAGSASFVGGSGGKASAQNLFSDNAATGTVNSDVNVTAGKAITLTTTTDLKVAGGPGAENSALVLAGLVGGIIGSSSIGAISGTATATVTGKVNFTAGTALNVTAGGNIDIQGGSRGGSGAVVTAAGGSSNRGHNATATLNVDTSVNLKGATVTLTANSGGVGSGDVDVTTFAVPSSGASPVQVASNDFHNTATSTINQSVSITGKTVTINGNLNKSTASSSHGIVNHTITITGHAVNGFSPLVLHPMAERVNADALHVSPMDTGTSFGGVQRVPSTSFTPAVQPATVIGTGDITVPAPVVSSLDTLQSQGLVLDLVTLLAAPATKTGQVTVFLPVTTLTDPSSSFPSSCAALVLKPEAAQRCSAGGK